MPPSHLESVAIVSQSNWRYVYTDLARRLRQRHGSHVTVYCDEEGAEFFRAQSDAFDEIVPVPDFWSVDTSSLLADPAGLIDRARELEQRYGVTMNRFAMTNRHLGRGYALAGFHHPRSRLSQETGYLEMIALFVALLSYWEKQLASSRPSLVLNPGVLQGPVARAQRIPTRTLASARHLTYYMWTVNEFFENPAVEKAFSRLGDVDSVELARPSANHLALRDRTLDILSLSGFIKDATRHTARRLYARARGWRWGSYYYLGSELAYLARQRRDGKRMIGSEVSSLDRLGAAPFAFYPLHTEPELSVQVLSPEYFYQHAAIAGLSRDLPAGVRLAVKETTDALGRRPTDFYDQIMELKNVVMLDMRELGLEVVRRAAVVCTITGTAGFEAAALGRPVVSFGRRNIYNFLPHVRVVRDEADLHDHLDWALGGGFDERQAVVDGQRMLAAIQEVSYDLGPDFSFRHPDRYDRGAIEEIAEGLVASLAEGEPSHEVAR